MKLHAVNARWKRPSQLSFSDKQNKLQFGKLYELKKLRPAIQKWVVTRLLKTIVPFKDQEKFLS